MSEGAPPPVLRSCERCHGQTPWHLPNCQWCGLPFQSRQTRNYKPLVFIGSAVLVAVLAALVLAGGFLPGLIAQPEPGAGTVTFGSSVNNQTLEIVGPTKTSFRSGETLAWRAVLAEPANATSLRLTISKRLGGTAERLLHEEAIPIGDPRFQILANEVPLPTLMLFLDGTGPYVMRYMRETTTLAQGAFEILP